MWFIVWLVVGGFKLAACQQYPEFGPLNGKGVAAALQQVGYSLAGSDGYFRVLASRRGAEAQAQAYDLLRRSDAAVRVINVSAGAQPSYGHMPCVPMFSYSRSTWSWFRRLHMVMDVCYSMCPDGASCTATAPLYRAPADSCSDGSCLHTFLRTNPPMFYAPNWRGRPSEVISAPKDESGEPAFAVYATAKPTDLQLSYKHLQRSDTDDGRGIEVLVQLETVRPSLVLALTTEHRNFPVMPLLYAPLDTNSNIQTGVLQTLYRDDVRALAEAACEAVRSGNASFLQPKQIKAAWLISQAVDGNAGGYLVRWDANTSYGALSAAAYNPPKDAFSFLHRVNDQCVHTEPSLNATLEAMLGVTVPSHVLPDCYPEASNAGPRVDGYTAFAPGSSRNNLDALAVTTPDGMAFAPIVNGCDDYGQSHVTLLRNTWVIAANRTDAACPYSYVAAGRFTVLVPGTTKVGYNHAADLATACGSQTLWWPGHGSSTDMFGKLAGEPLRHRVNATAVEAKIQERLVELKLQFDAFAFNHRSKGGIIGALTVMVFGLITIWTTWSHELRDQALRYSDMVARGMMITNMRTLSRLDRLFAAIIVYFCGMLALAAAAAGLTLAVMEDYTIEFNPNYPLTTVQVVADAADPMDSRDATRNVLEETVVAVSTQRVNAWAIAAAWVVAALYPILPALYVAYVMRGARKRLEGCGYHWQIG